jgi:6-phospho-3-hexuloisomerase
LLLVASGSGTTSSVVSSETKESKATVIAITADASKIAGVADNLTNKCCNKTDFGVSVSRQYAGSLFEQLHYLSEGVL